MVSLQLLKQAADQDLIQNEQIEPLLEFLNSQKPDQSTVNENTEEPLKFIRSFGDIFITLGIILLVLAINMLQISGYLYLIPAAGFLLLAEWLVRVRRLSLPGIAILLAILYFVNKAIEFNHEQASTFGLAVLSITSLIFYLRYRMPFSLFPLAAGIVAIILLQIGLDVFEQPSIFIALGLAVFIAAMSFDIQDTRRTSHLSDSAFWLHLLAAPLIVHGSMVTLLINDPAWLQDINKEIIMIVFFAIFFMLALLLDRRALLISTQLYAIYALTQLLQNQLSNTQNLLMMIMMALGLFVIFFGTYWYKTRRFLFGFLSGSAISRFIPDLSISDINARAG